jgi:hypothetical protein
VEFVVDKAALVQAGFLRLILFTLPIIHSINCARVIIIYHKGLVQYANMWP